MKLVITGGSGLLGRHLVAHLRGSHEITVLDILPPPIPGHHFIQQDILDQEGLTRSFRGQDAVIHLAAIPHPLTDTPGRIYQVNALGTFNALEAAANNGIGRFVFASSESVFGLVFSDRDAYPRYLPLDEEHPMYPDDPYGLSKLVAEEVCQAYARKTGMAVFALRPCWIWTPEEIDLVRRLVDHPEEWKRSFWAYIHVDDVCRAFELALTNHKEGFDSCLISAPDNGTRKKSMDLIKEFYDAKRITIDRDFGGRLSFISSRKAENILGFEARNTWKNLLREK